MSRFNKDHQWKMLVDWIVELESKVPGQHESFRRRLGNLDPLAVLSKMTATEMMIIVSLMTQASSMGHSDCRESFKQMKQDRFNPPVFARRSSFKVIQGGAV